MLLFTISILCSLAALSHAQTVASQAQFRFAVENKYDDTGPGAKQKEFAYKTYSNYEDALVAYATDKDTKLPEPDKNRAYRKLVRQEEYRAPSRYVHQSHTALRNFPRVSSIPHQYIQPLRHRMNRLEEFENYQPLVLRQQPRPAEEYTKSFQNLRLEMQKIPVQIPLKVELSEQLQPSPTILQQLQGPKLQFLSYPERTEITKPDFPLLLELSGSDGKRLQIAKGKEYKLKMIKPIKESRLRLSHYKKGSQDDEAAQNPEYTYSYGVHDRLTGDSKAAHETREGGTVRGFYTVVDPDGKQRTVHYTADDKQGFRASVQRTDLNAH